MEVSGHGSYLKRIISVFSLLLSESRKT